MAIFRPGPLVGAVSGKLGSLTFVESKGGRVIRRAQLPTDRASKSQLSRRRAIGTVARYWGDLSNDQRQAWASSAANLVFSNRLGLSRHLTGWQLFLKYSLAADVTAAAPPPVFNSITKSAMFFPTLVSLSNSIDWRIGIPKPPAPFSADVSVSFSRPHTETAPRHFGNWFNTTNFSVFGPTSLKIYETTDEIPGLYGTAVGEIIGLRLSWSVSTATIGGLFSAPTIVAGTVVA